ncbi:MAG TPA: acetate kinase, partial [Alphaproteobacteria bacterium]|nr:acetate kinase [Alphaproteobacteria bacterium]
MKQAVLAINAGSSSLKFAAFSVADGATALDPELRGEVDRIGNTGRFTVQSALDAPLIDESIQTS